MSRALALCAAVAAVVAVGCSGGSSPAADGAGASDGGAAAPSDPVSSDPTPPALPADFTWVGRYVVPDLDVEVPFTWHGDGGDFQMVAGGEGEEIHFTNLIHDGHLYTLTYTWPGVPRSPCSYVGPFTVEELNEGLHEAAYVGRETLHDDPDREVHHYRSTSVLELPAELIPELEGAPTLRLPLMAGDVYVDADDHTVFRKVLHFGLQNLYDPNLDEWIEIDRAEAVPGEVSLPDECAAALADAAA